MVNISLSSVFWESKTRDWDRRGPFFWSRHRPSSSPTGAGVVRRPVRGQNATGESRAPGLRPSWRGAPRRSHPGLGRSRARSARARFGPLDGFALLAMTAYLWLGHLGTGSICWNCSNRVSSHQADTGWWKKMLLYQKAGAAELMQSGRKPLEAGSIGQARGTCLYLFVLAEFLSQSR